MTALTTNLVVTPRYEVRRRREWIATASRLGLLSTYIGLLVAIPVVALLSHAVSAGPAALWQAISAPESLRAVGITLWCSIVATVINTVMGTATAWVLVRDTFRGQFLLQGLVDIPFALPTVVAGVTLMTLYGPNSALHIHLVGTWMGIAVALLFVTLPFCVRTVQPVLESLTRSAEDASLTLGASAVETFRYVTLPRLVPSMATGAGLAFARALGEFGSVVFISGNRPFHTEVGSSYIFMLSQSQRFNEAAAVSLELMVVALGVLTGIHFLTLRRSVRRTR